MLINTRPVTQNDFNFIFIYIILFLFTYNWLNNFNHTLYQPFIIKWSNGVLDPSQDSFMYIEVASSGMDEVIGVPGENHQASTRETTIFLKLEYVLSGIKT